MSCLDDYTPAILAFLAAERAAEAVEIGKYLVENEDDFNTFEKSGGPIPDIEFHADKFMKWCEARAAAWREAG